MSTPKLCLNMIVKNESKNLTRLFDSIKHIVDDYIIIDTGSTDDTREVIKKYWDQLNIKGHIENIPFKNFGYNRTEGLKMAREKSKSDYVLLLDADMVIIDEGFNKNELINKETLTLKQKNDNIQWRNTRIIKNTIKASCIGVTHEYYDIKGAKQEQINTLSIKDIGDGGCKEDKFERDIKLLEQGIEDEPNNNRYYFYLAQSYRDINNIDKSIEFYKKHIKMAGWEEEIWYSYYMIGTLYLRNSMEKEAEEWIMKGFIFRTKRAEGLYALCKYFREKGNYQKAYYYCVLAKAIPYPKDDSLFLEYKIYDYELDFEYSIINFYIPHANKKEAINSALNFINKSLDDNKLNLTLKNINFYIEALKQSALFKIKRLSKQQINFNNIEYSASSPSIFKNKDIKICNIRYVSYKLTNNPMIFERDKENLIQTKNLLFDFKDNTYKVMDEVILYPEKHQKINEDIRGIEDIRIFEQNGKLKFIGQSGDFKNKKTNIVFNMVLGTYDYENNKLLIEQILESPYDARIEKNWVHLNNDLFIYRWFPLEIGFLEDKTFNLKHKVNTPAFFKNFKGSSCGFLYKNMYWFLTHYTTDEWRDKGLWRQYKHCIVVLDEKYQPIAYSNPFTFENETVGYSLGMIIENNKICFGYSLEEKDASVGELNLEYVFEELNFVNKNLFYENIVKNDSLLKV
jgi:tetratricopeptide (TPR) repeat protein